eukprot:1408969-Prymnesium_polylepis.1
MASSGTSRWCDTGCTLCGQWSRSHEWWNDDAAPSSHVSCTARGKTSARKMRAPMLCGSTSSFSSVRAAVDFCLAVGVTLKRASTRVALRHVDRPTPALPEVCTA